MREELTRKDIIVGEGILDRITEDIMNISYSKGGDYSSEIIRRFAKGYFEKGLYKRYLYNKV